MTLPPLPPPPRLVPPALERQLVTRGATLVFWIYALLTCGASFIIAGIYGGNRTTITSGAVLVLCGLATLAYRHLTKSSIPGLLRSGDWVTGRVTRVEAGPRVRRLHYRFRANGVSREGVFEEDKPWAEDVAEGGDVAVMFDAAGSSVPLAPGLVELACEAWGIGPPPQPH